ncbi:VWA domain-containing protein [uncultured Pseudoteredinibacter sp.]|uniref:VWA domain-containing protein n=1 Tax=uncultured Pseudoteredinibacter sp. TaxID=1641701 RepID=UPI00261232F1|nr:VWA domain-containing protein [uncultured Pseudoteredinibacter sp.]
MARKRKFTTFNLSFLDIMSCGFGAVALIFLIIKHDMDRRQLENPNELSAEVNMLNEDIQAAKALQVRARNSLSDVDQQLLEAQGLARQVNEDIKATRTRLADIGSADKNTLEELKQEIQNLQLRKSELEEENKRGNDLREITGQGNRQYLTGLKLGGQRIVILLDASASMLDETIVNVIRRRNMSPEQQRAAAKWQRAVATVEWLIAKFPVNSQYQIYTFNTEVSPLIANTKGQWLDVSNRRQLQQGLDALNQLTPKNGTSLIRAFESLSSFQQLPDNVFLITDGLPTQGKQAPRKKTVDGNERMRLYNRAVNALPSGLPINIILAPMEGDTMAAAAYWQLAHRSKGSFMSPSKDWP